MAHYPPSQPIFLLRGLISSSGWIGSLSLFPLAEVYDGLQQASLSSYKCHSKPEPSPRILVRKNILKTLTQTFIMLYNLVELIQVKFPWEIQAPGQEQEVVRVTWGHRVPWRDQRKSGALSLTRKKTSEDKSHPFHIWNLRPWSVLGGGILEDLQTSAAVGGSKWRLMGPAQTTLSKWTPATRARFSINLIKISPQIRRNLLFV